ncbi:prepilin-type N-terminal cleavage/methylation domain-containing protein [Stutzerimonas stutzeri]|uniref:prepilin-type N-terminal cleavage/methylation domain-containing protein n=1 Tax=Stutzerimonas stutzeri TaxID=316 RepID=UPI000F771BB3|nr:prepilin-type N-terminal cleavage/methylation domain-containing protein [Stutzerimonas stutzeri]RSH64922.1 prepilin-type N-terminal cleavage/methylation domain-containing protein [Stutzerimonas stutzeri]
MPFLNRGFTLVELMIVLAIIGLLLALALPKFSEQRSKTNDTIAQSDTRNAMLLFSTNLIR